MEKNKLGTLFILFITIIIGAILVSSLADSVWENVNTYPVTNETLDIQTARETERGDGGLAAFDDTVTLTLANDFIVSISGTHDNGTALVKDTDWRWVEQLDGTINMLNSSTNTAWNLSESNTNNTLWTYTHGDEYVKSSIGRTLLDNFLVLFFIIGLVVWAIYTVKKQFIDDVGF